MFFLILINEYSEKLAKSSSVAKVVGVPPPKYTASKVEFLI
ncbi:hypothetical protein ACWO4B_000564 [Clostridium sporogenes]